MSIVDQAISEMRLAKFDEDDITRMTVILENFFDQWDSGGAVSVMAPVLQRLIAGKPLSPLTGADDEWFDHGGHIDCLQNIRCGSVFKSKATGYCTDVSTGETVTFPYMPDKAEVPSCVLEVKVKE